ncbi:MAG: glycine cleavage system protein GcvH [Pseudomonadota bacterium]|nr:glycine cleavage system protein GcvH [Pseudomonadota bacterium]
MTNLKYTKEHEWILMHGDTGTVGISKYAQEQLGEVVFVELPEIGRKFERDDEVAVVESNKAASEVYAPVDGEIMSVNKILESDPTIVNRDAEGEGWFYQIKPDSPSDFDELMDASEYKVFIQQLS